jgi:hypothetical protein
MAGWTGVRAGFGAVQASDQVVPMAGLIAPRPHPSAALGAPLVPVPAVSGAGNNATYRRRMRW